MHGLYYIKNCNTKLWVSLIHPDPHQPPPKALLNVTWHLPCLRGCSPMKWRNPCVVPDRPLVLQKVEAPRISRLPAYDGAKVVSPMHRPPLRLKKHPWYNAWFQASAAKQMRIALLWAITQQVVVITTDVAGPTVCPETSVRNHYSLRYSPEERSSHAWY
jgi:hypothetical protein